MNCQQSKEAVEDNQADKGDDSENAEGTTVFVKNLNFDTDEDSLKEVMEIGLFSYLKIPSPVLFRRFLFPCVYLKGPFHAILAIMLHTN